MVINNTPLPLHGDYAHCVPDFAPAVRHVDSTLRRFADEGKKVMSTSSFQTHSLPLLHLLSRAAVEVEIYLLDTGYHFAETLGFAHRVADEFGLDLRLVRSPVPKSQQLDPSGRFLFAADPDYCCELNKTLPTEALLADYDVWISGVRADQNQNRAGFDEFMRGPSNTTRWHPMLGWTKQEVWAYVREYGLPRHPLDDAGYLSIGCAPCTRKIDPAMSERDARWAGLNKTECGLHTSLVTAGGGTQVAINGGSEEQS